jgi:hypothetical protein
MIFFKVKILYIVWTFFLVFLIVTVRLPNKLQQVLFYFTVYFGIGIALYSLVQGFIKYFGGT